MDSFTHNPEEVLQREIELSASCPDGLFMPTCGGDDENSLHSFFKTAEVVEWILTNNFQRVALQFPDFLLSKSVAVKRALENEMKQKIAHSANIRSENGASKDGTKSVLLFVTADNMEGDFSVDFGAAEHLQADAIVTYGPISGAKTERLPVKVVSGVANVDEHDLVQALKNLDSEAFSSQEGTIVTLLGPGYGHLQESVQQALPPSRYVFGRLQSELGDQDSSITTTTQASLDGRRPCDLGSEGNQDIDTESTGQSKRFLDRTAGSFVLSKAISRESPVPTIGVYVGGEGPLMTVAAMERNLWTWKCYDASEQRVVEPSKIASRQVKRRYYTVHQARDADRIGLVIGSTSASGFLEEVHALRKLVESAGRRAYVFHVGKINEAKLSNFPEVDAYCIVACPEHSVFDRADWIKPVVTPWELRCALGPDDLWAGGTTYSMNWQWQQKQRVIAASEEGTFEEAVGEGDGTQFSFLSGRVRNYESGTSGSTDLVVRDLSASALLEQRTWSGLDKDAPSIGASLEQNEGDGTSSATAAKLEQGRKGLAWHYGREDEDC